jgi:hypothetical protein
MVATHGKYLKLHTQNIETKKAAYCTMVLPNPRAYTLISKSETCRFIFEATILMVHKSYNVMQKITNISQ